MRICVHGLWHQGTVIAACLAMVGHDVVCLDSDSTTITQLSRGNAPVFEPGLDDLLRAGIAAGKLTFHTEPSVALANIEAVWVAFDTPVDDDDLADVSFVLEAVKSTLNYISDGTVVLISSQIPVGSVSSLEKYAKDSQPLKNIRFAYSPENLRLGKAIDIFLNPDRLVVGFRTEQDRQILKKFLVPVTDRIEWMSVESAEMTKHAINAFLATSVAFANEISAICEISGADAKQVERGLKTEDRIGPKARLAPGGPFAGGTLARDISFLTSQSNSHGLSTPLLSAVRSSNDEHKKWIRRKLLQEFQALKDETIAIWGLTYKPNTNTLRRSLVVELCDWLLTQGAQIRVYDPIIQSIPERWIGKIAHCSSAIEAIKDSSVLVIGTEWPEFVEIANLLMDKVKPGFILIDPNYHLQDLRSKFKAANIKYIAVGTAQADTII